MADPLRLYLDPAEIHEGRARRLRKAHNGAPATRDREGVLEGREVPIDYQED